MCCDVAGFCVCSSLGVEIVTVSSHKIFSDVGDRKVRIGYPYRQAGAKCLHMLNCTIYSHCDS